MGKWGFSWKRMTGVTKAKRRVSRATGVPLTKSGRQRKIGRIVTGGKGCLLSIFLITTTVTTCILVIYVLLNKIV